MDWHHPDRENLFRLVLGTSSPEETHRIERHLAKCRDCREAVDEIGASLGPCLLDSWLLPGYDEAFENAADRAKALLTAWRHHVLAGEDAYTEGELLSFTASLRTSQGRFDEAAR